MAGVTCASAGWGRDALEVHQHEVQPQLAGSELDLADQPLSAQIIYHGLLGQHYTVQLGGGIITLVGVILFAASMAIRKLKSFRLSKSNE